MSDDYGTTYEERAQIAEAELARLRDCRDRWKSMCQQAWNERDDTADSLEYAEAELARLRAELSGAKTLLALFVEHWTTEYTSNLKEIERLGELADRARDFLAQEPPA